MPECGGKKASKESGKSDHARDRLGQTVSEDENSTPPGDVALDGQGVPERVLIELARAGQLEATLAQERAILNEVVARMPAAVALLWGPEHRIRLFNDRGLESFPEA